MLNNMTPKLDPKLLDYIYSWDTPVEVDFFTAKERDQLNRETKKLHKTQEYYEAVANNPGLGSQMERDVALGTIYSQGEINKILNRVRALESTGDREFLDVSLVSPTGQRIIMSQNCADALGLITDGFVLPDELVELVDELRFEGITDDKINKVEIAMKTYGAVVLQRGAYEDLLDLLDQATGDDLRKSQFAKNDAEFEEVKTTFESAPGRGMDLEVLKATMNIPVPPKATPLEKTAFADELKREISTPELGTPVGSLNIRTKQIPLPPPIKEEPKPVKFSQNTPSLGLKRLQDIKAVDDLKKVQTEHLRQAELSAQIGLKKARSIKII
jgi:hypothetical protein